MYGLCCGRYDHLKPSEILFTVHLVSALEIEIVSHLYGFFKFFLSDQLDVFYLFFTQIELHYIKGSVGKKESQGRMGFHGVENHFDFVSLNCSFQLVLISRDCWAMTLWLRHFL